MPEIIIFIVSLLIAIRGADWIGRAAISIAKKFGLSHIVVGATIVAIATTLPEIVTAFIAGNINKDPLYGVGLLLGSPIVNLGLILGTLFIVSKHQPSLGYYSRSVNVFILVSTILFILSLYRPIGGIFSLILIILGVAYLLLELFLSQRQRNPVDTAENRFEKFISFFHLAGDKDVVLEIVFGTLFLTLGSKFLVDSGIAIASSLQIHDFYLSTVVLALGTSVPELITVATSIVRKRHSLSVGNLIGASVIDITIGIGLATLSVPAVILAPYNFLFFITLMVLGVICLLVLFPKFSPTPIGGLLLAVATSFLILFTILEFTKL